MPTYTYHCGKCKQDEEQIRKIADRDTLILCRRCRIAMDRKIEAPGMVWAPTSTSGGMKV